MKKLMLVAVLMLTSVLLLPSVASAKTPTLKKLAKTVAALQRKVSAQATTIASQGAKLTTQAATIAALQNSNVMALNPYLSVTAVGSPGAVNGVIGPNIVLTGANLQVKSSTSESDTSGTGNLIVGWDPGGGQERGGSNNLVVGYWNNFSSYGGFVAGANNTVSNVCGSVSGGYANMASGLFASVSGGQSGSASGESASISGGIVNHATGYCCSVSGGGANYAQDAAGAVHSYASVSGGYLHTANTLYGWAGGTYHTP
jgi:hypothetical protein